MLWDSFPFSLYLKVYKPGLLWTVEGSWGCFLLTSLILQTSFYLSAGCLVAHSSNSWDQEVDFWHGNHGPGNTFSAYWMSCLSVPITSERSETRASIFLIALACRGAHYSAGFLLHIAHEYLPVFKINQCWLGITFICRNSLFFPHPLSPPHAETSYHGRCKHSGGTV